MRCPECGSSRIGVYNTYHPDPTSIKRYRACSRCGFQWKTLETRIPWFRQYRDARGRFRTSPTPDS